MENVIATINRLFPSDPSVPNGPSVRLDLFPPPDYEIFNCFSVALVEKVHAENKLSEPAKEAEQPLPKKKRPSHIPPAPPKQPSKVPVDIVWSPDQKELIDTVRRHLDQVQDWKNSGCNVKRLPTAPTLLVVGGPGNGKTTTLSKISEMCAESNFPLISACPTG